ncbi:MAG: DNA alkylation repair protein [Gammaproteobacteria bacterium]|nr:DNA alkylation repair protein [Gammaproteobacteria bacterium]MCY4277259.1 DNA alkylation repair protein [Gammaproteobacteria bacterium]MCY4322987.1 DNA alkylation repair protein [Gammaproteobacteria bacterium]
MSEDWTRRTIGRIDSLPRTDTAHLRTVGRWLLDELRERPTEAVVDVALELLAKGHRLIACELVQGHDRALRSLDITRLEAFGADMSSWHAVDIFCVSLAGPCWREGQISDQDIERWASSESPWWRRAALVATTGLNVRTRGGYGDSDRTLAVARLLVDDRADTVVKALSWALRELIYWEPDRVEAFLVKHQDRLAARVKREVKAKLETGLKTAKARANPRRSRRDAPVPSSFALR